MPSKKCVLYIKKRCFHLAAKSIMTEYYLCNLRQRYSTCTCPVSCGEGELILTLNIRESNCTYKSFLLAYVSGTHLWQIVSYHSPIRLITGTVSEAHTHISNRVTQSLIYHLQEVDVQHDPEIENCGLF